MVKTQVQFPDHLYHEAKRVAQEYEMSFAEVVRRGVEHVVQLHPSGRTQGDAWELPEAIDMGKTLLPESEWDLAARDDA